MANVSSSNGLEKRPKLRFPGFDEPWRAAQLGNLLIELSDYATQESGFPLLTSSRQGLFVQEDYFIDKQANAETTVFSVLPYGCITYRHMSDDNIFHFNINRLVANGLVSKEYPVFTVRKEVLDTDFLVDTLNSSPLFSVFCIQQKKGGTRTRLYFKTLCSYQMFLPVLHEQQVIASFIRLLDKRIERQMELVETLKKYKRGVFETVFSQKVRLIPRNKRKDWQKYKLSDFATRVTRKNGGQSDIPLTISAQYGLIDQRDFFSKTVASADMSGYYLLRSGEYAYNRSTSNDYPFGSIKRLELYPMGAVSTLYLCFRVKDDIVLSDLAKWYFESSQWHRGVNEICAEGARNHGLLNVPTDGFFNTVHTLPSDPEEQLAIASYLSLFQARLDSAQAVLEKLLRIRSGLMQRLFT